MIKLSRSKAWRTKAKSPRDGVVVQCFAPPENGNDSGVSLRFDIGTPIKHEYIEVDIHPADFHLLLTEMLDFNRGAFLDAVARAILARPEPSA
ncbi:hypothetical protein HFN62_16415 [Rhizobium leguminosarum]|nr:hypothetical protein [Rhizobium leguminosarum]MBY5785301.1 hypothetical protein [Rhizobium leguminosarum]